MRLTEPRTYRWSKEEFHQMADLGWFDDKRVELLDGEIIEMPVAKPPHVMALGLSEEALGRAFGAGFWVRTQAPLALDPDSEPEPDLAVVPGGPRDYPEHPTTALLIVEVSDTTLFIDRNRKASLYARGGIADYWIINLVDDQLEVYRNPVPDSSAPSGFRYADRTVLSPADSVSPLAAPSATVAVAYLLP
jgi:Uma2 family endonuclease